MRRIDLLPSAYQERRRERRNLALVVVASMLVLLLIIGWWVLLGTQVSSEKDRLADAQRTNQSLQAQIAELSRFADLQAEVATKQQALVTVMTGDVDWPRVMTEIAMVIPGEVWLTTLTASAGQTEGAAPVGTESAPIRVSDQVPFGRISFQGRSLTMPGVAKWLVSLRNVREFAAIWLNTATAGGEEGAETVDFDSTLELSDRAASRRFLDGVGEGQ
ncbi:MAG TPA: PilN domain-containing protein [Actinomycetota bacterium]|nr:PilN domain-containing protein [Actinomycetota bacterium]